MARNATVSLINDVWTELTNSDVTHISFQNLGNEDIEILGSTSATPPADDARGYIWDGKKGAQNLALNELFLGMGAVRLFARTEAATKVRVDHA